VTAAGTRGARTGNPFRSARMASFNPTRGAIKLSACDMDVLTIVIWPILRAGFGSFPYM
jgi:hypothetical protein